MTRIYLADLRERVIKAVLSGLSARSVKAMQRVLAGELADPIGAYIMRPCQAGD